MKKISCIICAYNEEQRISNVLRIVVDNPLINETIVVDDHSTDNTSNKVLRFKKVKLIKHKENMGKSRSMIDGCKKAKNDFVMFLDADLIGLTHNNITQLANPVIGGLVDMTMSMRKNSFFLYRFFGHDFISGERVLKRILALKILKNVSGYGAEVKINDYILEHKLKFLVVKWMNVAETTKQRKIGFIKGCIHDLIMCKQVLHALSFFKVFKQILVMGILSAKYRRELLLKK